MCGQVKCKRPCDNCTCNKPQVVAKIGTVKTVIPSMPLTTALALVEDPDNFMECYCSMKKSKLEFMDWPRRDGGKVYLKRTRYEHVAILGAL